MLRTTGGKASRKVRAASSNDMRMNSLMGDLLYEFSEWLRDTPLTEFALWISETRLSAVMVENFWAIPIVQVIHIAAIAASFVAVLILGTRSFGMAGHASFADTSRRYTRVLWWSLAVLLASGLLMIVGEPVRELINPIFWIKMILIVVGVLAAVVFAGGLRRQLATGDGVGGSSRAIAALLIVLWIGIIFGGRWIAYAPV